MHFQLLTFPIDKSPRVAPYKCNPDTMRLSFRDPGGARFANKAESLKNVDLSLSFPNPRPFLFLVIREDQNDADRNSSLRVLVEKSLIAAEGEAAA